MQDFQTAGRQFASENWEYIPAIVENGDAPNLVDATVIHYNETFEAFNEPEKKLIAGSDDEINFRYGAQLFWDGFLED